MSLSITFDRLDRMPDFKMKNATGTIRWISPVPTDDVIPIDRMIYRLRTEQDIASLVIATTQRKALPIEALLNSRKPIIEARNDIIHNPLKYFNPFYWSQLKDLDKSLDEIDLQIFELERDSTYPKEEDLKAIISAASSSIQACYALLDRRD